MARMTTLIKEARTAATARGHKLGRFRSLSFTSGIATCKNPACYASVVCNSKPAPNEIDVGGTALALNCPVKETN